LCHTTQHRAVLIIFPLNLQTITITRMLSSKEGGGKITGKCKAAVKNTGKTVGDINMR